MQKSLLSLLLLFSPIAVFAEDTTEGRITEHSVVSFVALAGLLFVAHFARKSRKTSFEMND